MSVGSVRSEYQLKPKGGIRSLVTTASPLELKSEIHVNNAPRISTSLQKRTKMNRADLSCSERGLPLPGGIRESAARMASTRSPQPFRAHAQ